jgi:hypothetical protein
MQTVPRDPDIRRDLAALPPRHYRRRAIMTKSSPPRTKTARTSQRAVEGARMHPRAFPFIANEADADVLPDQPFADGAIDAIDPDLRYRMISEAAYRRYAERGYEDGYDQDDWLQAEEDVDHFLLNRGPTV